jgi:amino acid adenylation domain-containing protein
MLVTDFLKQSAVRLPQKTALVSKEGRFSYREIDSLSDGLAAGLVDNGFQRGQRAVVFLDNSMEAVISIFGVMKAGGVFLAVNPTTKAEKLSYIINNCRASALIAPFERRGMIADVCGGTPSIEAVCLSGQGKGLRPVAGKRNLVLEEVLKQCRGAGPERPAIDADLATIIYTSGSTGSPKGVMMTHHSMVSAANSITEYLENKEEDVILNTLPLSFDYGLYQAIMAFKTGATLVLEKGFLYPYKVIETMLREKVTGLPIVPTISAILLQMEDVKGMTFEHLRYITNTAAALPSWHIRKLREFFPGARIYSMYGLTECKRALFLPPHEIDARPDSVGRAMPNTEAFVVDEAGERVGPGVVGELVVRGSNVMKGYWEMPEETEKRLRPGAFSGDVLLYTGDLFKTDEDGFLYFVGRKDDIIKSRGEKVSPKEIENCLYSMEGVVEAAVVGVPDDVLGQAIKAFIVRRQGSKITEREVQAYCKARLEDFLVPKFVQFVPDLPKTDTGKIRKSSLRGHPGDSALQA